MYFGCYGSLKWKVKIAIYDAVQWSCAGKGEFDFSKVMQMQWGSN